MIRWEFYGQAPWAPRGWHSSAVFHNEIWILGGSPLSNDVWRASNLSRVESLSREKTYVGSYGSAFRWHLTWHEVRQGQPVLLIRRCCSPAYRNMRRCRL